MPLTRSTPRLAWYRTGPEGAPPLVFVGGLGSVQAAWLNQVRHFAGRFDVITFDHRGTGDSEDAGGPMRMEDYAADLVRLLDELGVGRASFVGLSFGARTLMALVLGWPARVERLVVGGISCGASRAVAGASPAPLRAAPLPDEAAEARRWEEEVIPLLFGADWRARHPERIRQLARWRARHPARPEGLQRQWEANVGFDLCDRLAEVRVPVLVVHGEQDVLSPVENARRLAAAIPGASLAVLPGVGHSPNVEDPTAFHAAIDAFFLRM